MAFVQTFNMLAPELSEGFSAVLVSSPETKPGVAGQGMFPPLLLPLDVYCWNGQDKTNRFGISRSFFSEVGLAATSKSCFKFIQLKDFREAPARVFYYTQNALELPLELTLALRCPGVIFHSVLTRTTALVRFFVLTGALHRGEAMLH